jgi:hypothetical protein
MRLLFFIGFIIGFLLILTSCNKHEKAYLYVPQLYKDVAFFKKNSYWVYLNEKTSQVDCTYTKSDPVSYFELGELTYHEVITVPFDGNLFTRENLFTDAVFLSSIIQPDFGIILIQSSSERIDSLSTIFNVFHNIYHTRHVAYPAQSDSIIFDTYTVPHVGIIKLSKKTAGTDTTFSLMRWNAMQ